MNLRKDLSEKVLIADGAMGTLLYSYGVDRSFEELNLSHPEDIVAIHKAYIGLWGGYYPNEYVWRKLY